MASKLFRILHEGLVVHQYVCPCYVYCALYCFNFFQALSLKCQILDLSQVFFFSFYAANSICVIFFFRFTRKSLVIGNGTLIWTRYSAFRWKKNYFWPLVLMIFFACHLQILNEFTKFQFISDIDQQKIIKLFENESLYTRALFVVFFLFISTNLFLLYVFLRSHFFLIPFACSISSCVIFIAKSNFFLLSYIEFSEFVCYK